MVAEVQASHEVCIANKEEYCSSIVVLSSLYGRVRVVVEPDVERNKEGLNQYNTCSLFVCLDGEMKTFVRDPLSLSEEEGIRGKESLPYIHTVISLINNDQEKSVLFLLYGKSTGNVTVKSVCYQDTVGETEREGEKREKEERILQIHLSWHLSA